jgi:hypothetical protein
VGCGTPSQTNREGGTRSDWLGLTRAPYTPRAAHSVLVGTKCLRAQTLDGLSSLIVTGKWESRATAPATECGVVPAPEPCAFVQGSGKDPGSGGKDAQGMSSL